MDEDIKRRALALEEEGDCEALYQLIKPYVDANEPFALNLYAGFSLSSFNETEEEYSKRYIRLKTMASEGGISDASYRMGVNHLYGDDVEQSYSKAKMYFERAISQGHSYTKYTHGFSLYYGKNNNEKDEVRGLALIREAAAEGVQGAINELEIITGKNA